MNREAQARSRLRTYQRQPWLREFTAHNNAVDAVEADEHDNALYSPTPEQIAEACAEIQAGWSDTQRELRGEGPSVWALPLHLRQPRRKGSEPGAS